MAQRALIGLSIVLAFLFAGCPDTSTLAPPTELSLTTSTSPADGAAHGDAVALTASVVTDVDPARLSFRWYQTFGRTIELIDHDAAAATFVAPSFLTDETLRFRVDVRVDGAAPSASEEITLQIAADPEFGLGDGGGDGGGDEDPTPRVRLVTSLGTIVVELDRENAPLSTNNFLRYVDDGFYDNTIFHRVIAEFVVQGGGFETGLVMKDTRDPIRSEADNGLRNLRGTIAMARTNDPDSATSQFYFNLVDNDSLDASAASPGYTVFGRVVEGLDVVDDIAEVEIGDRDGFTDVPVEDVLLERAERVVE